jgi:hypothetical protein
MQAFSQKKYEKYRIEKSPFTIASDGCFITSLAAVHTKFFPDGKMDPPKMMALLEPIIGDKTAMMTITGLVGNLADKVGFEYISRHRQYNLAQISDFANKPDHAVIIDVDFNRFNTINTDQHFVAVSDCHEGMELMDPIDGKFKRGLPAQYAFKSFIVFRKIEKKGVVSDWAKEAVEWCKTKGISDWSNPQSVPDNFVISEMLHRTGHLKNGESMTKEQLALVLYRISELN